MELIIKEPIAVPAVVPHSFTVEIKVIHGDGDLYTFFTMPSFDAGNQLRVELMKDLLRTLDAMKETFEHTGRSGSLSQRYALKIPAFEPWFSSEDLTESYENAWYKPSSDAEVENLMSLAQEVNKLYTEQNFIDWPDDATTNQAFDLHNETTLHSYEVRYIDSHGVQHAVEIQA